MKTSLNCPSGCAVGKRIKAGLLDLLCILVGAMHISVPRVILIYFVFSPTEKFINIEPLFFVFDIFLSIIILGFVFKKGSIGKKVFKIKVVDIKTGRKPNFLKLFLVNFYSSANFFIGLERSLDRRTYIERLLKCSTVDLEEMWEYTAEGRWVKAKNNTGDEQDS